MSHRDEYLTLIVTAAVSGVVGGIADRLWLRVAGPVMRKLALAVNGVFFVASAAAIPVTEAYRLGRRFRESRGLTAAGRPSLLVPGWALGAALVYGLLSKDESRAVIKSMLFLWRSVPKRERGVVSARHYLMKDDALRSAYKAEVRKWRKPSVPRTASRLTATFATIALDNSNRQRKRLTAPDAVQ